MAASSAALFHLELMFTCVIGAGMAHTHAVQGLFHIFLTDTSRGFHGRYIGVCMSELRQDTSFASLLNSLTMLRDTVCPTEPVSSYLGLLAINNAGTGYVEGV